MSHQRYQFIVPHVGKDTIAIIEEYFHGIDGTRYIIGEKKDPLSLRGYVEFREEFKFDHIDNVELEIKYMTGSCRKQINSCIRNVISIHIDMGSRSTKQIYLETTPLLDYQNEILERIRTRQGIGRIMWYWSSNMVGKTTLCEYICTKYNAANISGNTPRMIKMRARWNPLRIFVLDIQNHHTVCYSVLEQMCKRKHVGRIRPIIICLAKFEPNMIFVSMPSRWNIRKI